MNRVTFFIDGFNVYHALDDNQSFHKYKWLDYSSLARCFVTSKDLITDIFYFTSYAEWNTNKKNRHQLFIKALTMKGVKVIFGKFKIVEKKCPLCKKIYKTFEEKQTDVNISIKLLRSACDDIFDTGMLISGDSDLIPSILAVKEAFPVKKIGLVIPIGRSAEEMKNVCDYHMKMKVKHLSSSQFPDRITLDATKGIFLDRPTAWT